MASVEPGRGGVRPPPWMVALEERLEAEVEDSDELATALVVLAAVAGENVPLDEATRHAATRRALLLLAAGGDPTRGLDLNGRAVTGLADELRDVDRQLALEDGLRELRQLGTGLPYVSEAVRALSAAPDVAWRAYACSLLADDLAGDDAARPD